VRALLGELVLCMSTSSLSHCSNRNGLWGLCVLSIPPVEEKAHLRVYELISASCLEDVKQDGLSFGELTPKIFLAARYVSGVSGSP
jgi:hypothetical protein